MTVCVCIASRGRPNELRRTIEQMCDRSVLLDTHYAVAIDDDDPECLEYGNLVVRKFGVGISAPREISLGAKYNRAASYARSGTTLYVLGVDDCCFSTIGWDKKLLDAAAKFQDGVGAVYFGPKHDDPYQLPESFAVTKGWIDQVGFFCAPHFPFWWHETWVDEIVRMTGRYVWADVQWDKHGEHLNKTQRMREVSWWARFFDSTRQSRVDKAMEMLNGLDYPEWLRTQLKQQMRTTANALWRRNSLVRDRGYEFERALGSESPIAPDAGYIQIRAEAEKMLSK